MVEMGNEQTNLFVMLGLTNLAINLQQGGHMPPFKKSLQILGLVLLGVAIIARVPQLRQIAYGA